MTQEERAKAEADIAAEQAEDDKIIAEVEAED